VLLFGKQWVFDVHGVQIRVENAWTPILWAQEQVLLDNVVMRRACGYLVFNRNFTLTAAETPLQAPLSISLYSGLWGIECKAWLGAESLAPQTINRRVWWGEQGAWPHARLQYSDSRL
jgi:hypothetical protein